MRLARLLCCVSLALLGGTASADSGGPVSVSVQLTTYTPGPPPRAVQSTSSYSLTCYPTGGTLPFANRICADIAAYPQTMLAPRHLGGSDCGTNPYGPFAVAQVTVTSGGATTQLVTDGSACDPGDVGAAVYFAAAEQNVGNLASLEPKLRCDEDATLFAKPRPNLSVLYCMTGRWTASEEQLLQLAEQVHAIAALHPTTLFPADIGGRACTIRPHVTGTCAVYLATSDSTQIVTFAQSWPPGSNRKKGHLVWHVAISGGVAAITSNAG